MTVRLENDAIRLIGHCGVEEAEDLLMALQANPTLSIDLRAAEDAHLAVVQLILASRRSIEAYPERGIFASLLRASLTLDGQPRDY